MKKFCIIFVFLFSTARLQMFAQGLLATDFNNTVSFTTGKYPVGVAVADLDNDGKPDMVIANEGSQSLSVFRCLSFGSLISTASFAARTDITLTGVNPENILVADIDGDTRPDLILTSSNGKTLSILRNTSTSGSISFAARVDLTIGYYAHSLALGDLDNDGKPDIAVTNFDAGTVSLYKNTSVSGTVSFAVGIDIITGGNPTMVSIGDLDGDSHADLAVVIHDRGLVSVFRNTNDSINTRGFSSRFDFPAGATPYAISINDMDGDGHADLLVTNIDRNNTVSILRNITSGTAINFSTKVDFSTGNHPYAVSIKDVNGDGKPDILVGNWVNSGTLSLLQNTSTSGSISTSSFTSAISLPVGANPASLAVADLNNDGKPDLVAANTFDGSLSVIQYYPVSAQHLPYAPSSASISRGSFVSTDLMDMEWKQEAPTGYAIAPDDGTTINAAGTAANNAGRFAYFWAMGSRTPLVRVQGNLTFTAKGNGAITVVILATNDLSVQASTTFTLTSSYQNFNWALTSLYPQQEYIIGVIFKGGSGTPQVNGQFKKNFCLTLRQAGLNDNFIRFRGDSTSLIGNSEKTWYGWSDVANAPRKKYLQHSAYARMRFITSATHLAIEYVRDFYDKHVLNLFASNQTIAPCNWDSAGNVVYTGSGAVNAINVYTRVTGGQTYTISGLKTTYPTYVWFQNGMPMGPPGYLSNVGTTAAPLYQVTAPVGATNLGLLVQRISDPSYAADPLNDSFQVYTNCMVQQGAIGTMTPLDGTVPSAFALFNGSAPSKISGPAVFINGSLYKYYQLDGNDLAKQVQIITDDLPAGSKTVEVMMPGEGTYLPANPHTRRAGTYLRAVYFADTTTTVASDTTRATGSVCFIHDSIISGFNISSDAQNNVWMMKLKRDPTFGFSGDVFSEGYAGRILHTDTSTPDSLEAFAQKLASFKVNTYWFQVGVNDYGFLTPLYSFYSEYKTLVERLRVLRPSAKIYIQSTGPESYEGPNGETYADDGLTTTGPAANDYRDVQRAIATSHSYCEYVNFEGLFAPTIDNVSDGIHPTDVGNSLYASGVKTKSSLLGTAPAGSSLAFYRSSTRHLIKTIQGIYVITATGGTAPYTFTLLSGTLPSGLTFHSDGTITGIPATNGTVSLSVKVTDAVAANVTQSFTLTVDNTPSIVVAPLNIIDAKVGTGYKKTFRGLGGHGHYTYSVTSGALPTGLTLNSTSGTLTGTPSASGNSSFTLTATDHWGFTGNTAHTLHVGTVTPVALTDSFKVTATVTDSNHLILQGHLHDYYSQLLYTYVAAYFTPAGGSETLIGGNFANVPAGTKDGPAVDFGGMALTPGNFSVRLQTTAISPGTLDSVNINYGTQIQSMYTSHSSPTDSITYTISINSGGHLLVTGHIPRLHSNVVYTYIGAYIQQSSSSYLSGQNVNISAGSLTSSPVDFGQITTVPSGSFTVTLANGGVFPSGMDGYNFVYAANTYFTRTRTW